MLGRGPLFGLTKLEILVEKCHMFMLCAMQSNGNTRSTYLIVKTFIYVNLLTLIRKAFDIHFVTNESDNKLILFERRFDVIFTSFSSSFKVRYD